MTIDVLLNNFAFRCFRDIGDGDYISARMAYRAGLIPQYLWATQQAIEKYLKCILLLNRIPAVQVRHDLEAGLRRIAAGGPALNLTPVTRKFIKYIDTYGRFRYLESSHHAFGRDIVRLDRTVWELRRYCTLDPVPQQIALQEGFPPRIVRIEGGRLERIVDDPRDRARGPLLYQNGFFGKRARRSVRVWSGLAATNSPLTLNPHLLDEVMKYVLVPRELQVAYRDLAMRKRPKQTFEKQTPRG